MAQQTHSTECRGSLSGQMVGEYRLDGLLGVGGMAEVYRAHDTLLDRDVAVKVLHEHLCANPEYTEWFRNEARHIAAFSHPHIVPIYRFGEEHGLFYLVMPILHCSLAKMLSKQESLDLAMALRIGVQIALGLAFAHEVGLVHRDVKPGNILLDKQGNALLADFGIARDIAALQEVPHHLQQGTNMLVTGTPQYMAPEQFRGDPIDQRVDIYALGAVIYRLLTGVIPHDAPTPLGLLTHRMVDLPELPSARNSHVPRALDRVLMRALASDPDERFPDAMSFARALRGTLPRKSFVPIVSMPADQSVLDVLDSALQPMTRAVSEDSRTTLPQWAPLLLVPASVKRVPARAVSYLRAKRQWLALATVLTLLIFEVLLISHGGNSITTGMIPLQDNASHSSIPTKQKQATSTPQNAQSTQSPKSQSSKSQSPHGQSGHNGHGNGHGHSPHRQPPSSPPAPKAPKAHKGKGHAKSHHSHGE